MLFVVMPRNLLPIEIIGGGLSGMELFQISDFLESVCVGRTGLHVG